MHIELEERYSEKSFNDVLPSNKMTPLYNEIVFIVNKHSPIKMKHLVEKLSVTNQTSRVRLACDHLVSIHKIKNHSIGADIAFKRA